MSYNYKKNKGDGYFNSDFIIKSNQQSQSTKGDYNSKNGYHNYRLGFAAELSKKQDFGLELYGNNNKTTFKKNNNIFITNDIPILQGDNFLNEKSEKYLYNVILNYTYKIDTINSKLKITADYIKHNYDNVADNNSFYDYGNVNNTERNTTNSETDLYSVQADLFKNFRNKIKTELGLKYGLTNRHNSLLSETLTSGKYVSNDRTSKLDYNERIIASYVSIGYNLNQKNYIKIGLRVENTDFLSNDKLRNDKNARNYFSWFPSAYYSNKLSKNSAISIGYSRRLQRPSFNILNNRVNKINDFSFDIGNPNLKPEFIDKYDISYNLKNHFFSIYFNNTTDAIIGIWRIEDSISIHQNQNYGTNRQFGFQYSSANINLTKWWIFRGNLHLYHRQFSNPNFNLEKTTFFFFLRNNFIINKTTSIEIYGNYMSPFLSANYIWAENISTNLIIKKSFFDNKLNIRLYIDDIFNTQRNKCKAEFIDSYFNLYDKSNTQSFTVWISYRFGTKKQIRNEKNQSSNDTKNRL